MYKSSPQYKGPDENIKEGRGGKRPKGEKNGKETRKGKKNQG